MALHTDHKWPAYGNNWRGLHGRDPPNGILDRLAYNGIHQFLRHPETEWQRHLCLPCKKKIIFWQIKPFFLETLVYAGLRWFMICSNLRLGKDLKGQMVELEVDKGSRMCIFLCMFICLLYLYVNVLLMYLQVCFYLHLTQLLMWPN